MVTVFYVGIYYNIIITYTVYYFGVSFTSNLPWVGCGNSWNTKYCYDNYRQCIDNTSIITDTNNTCVHLESLDEQTLNVFGVARNTSYDEGEPMRYDLSNYTDPLQAERKLASEEYWK